jgi:pimeloyl-ACP methyl ester carboxylesterase
MPSSRFAALQKSTIVRSFTFLERVAPAVGARWAEALWFRIPASGGRRHRLAEPGRPFQVRVHGRAVVGEAWGDPEAPAVYLMHGWGGWRWQLDGFVGPLVAAGFRVVTFDGPGHGDSDPGLEGPARSTILELADALAAVVAANGPAYAIIAHSLGATATAYALDHGLETGRLAFVSPMADPLPYTRAFAGRLGFGERTRARLVARIEGRVGTSMAAFAVPAMASRVETPPLLLVHDRQDTETSWSDSAAIARSWPGARLVSTTGLGHRRILRDPAVVAAVAGFVAAASAPDEPGSPPLDPRGDALAGVLGGEQPRQLLELAVDGVAQGALQPVVDHPGDGGHGQGGPGGQAGGQVGHRLVELAHRNQPVDHAEALGLGRGDGPAGRQ